MQLSSRLLPWRSAPERRWLAVVLGVTGLMLLLLFTLYVLRAVRAAGDQQFDASVWDRCDRHRKDMRVNVLAPMPDSDDQMLLQLFTHLLKPNEWACKRHAWFGGEPMFRTNTTAMMWGMKRVCLDAEFHMADHDCLVYSLRQPRDASFDEAAAAFACETHSFGPGPGRPRVHHHQLAADAAQLPLPQLPAQLDRLLAELGHRRAAVGYLALTADNAALAGLLEAAPRALRHNVRQLGVRLDLRALTTGVWAVWPEEQDRQRPAPAPPRHLHGLRQLYRSALALQQMDFYPFGYDQLDAADVGDFKVAGMEEPVPDRFEVAWLKSRCT